VNQLEWPARRVVPGRDTCNGSCETAPGCDCLRYHPAECGTELGADMPHSRDEACSPMVGVIVGSSIGALLICGALWAWRSL